jgi:hypothetical protein
MSLSPLTWNCIVWKIITNVSKEPAVSIFNRVLPWRRKQNCTFLSLVSIYRIKRCHVPGDYNIHSNRHESLKSHRSWTAEQEFPVFPVHEQSMTERENQQ